VSAKEMFNIKFATYTYRFTCQIKTKKSRVWKPNCCKISKSKILLRELESIKSSAMFPYLQTTWFV